MIAIKNDCALKSPVFCVPRVFHPRHSAIHQALTAYGAGLMGDSCSFDKNTPHGICDPWTCSPTCLFKRIERLGYSHRSRRFAQMRCVPHAKKFVPIREKAHPCASVKLSPVRSVGLRRVIFFNTNLANLTNADM